MISKEEVQKIAKLARLELTEKEIEKMQHDLSSILDYFNILKKAEKYQADDRGARAGNATRADVVEEKSAMVANNLIQQAPATKDGYIKVKQIF